MTARPAPTFQPFARALRVGSFYGQRLAISGLVRFELSFQIAPGLTGNAGAEMSCVLLGDRTGGLPLAAAVEACGGRLDVEYAAPRIVIAITAASAELPNLLVQLGASLNAASIEASAFSALRERLQATVRRLHADAESVAEFALRRGLYWPGSPHRDVLADADLAALDQATLQDFLRLQLRPRQVCIAAVGDFESEALAAAIETALAAWQERAPERDDFPAAAGEVIAEPAPAASILLPDCDYAAIAVGFRVWPDASATTLAALRLAEHWLAGAYGARLIQVLREQAGLTYALSSRWLAPDLGGHWQLSFVTQPEQVPAAHALLSAEFEQARDRPWPADEFAALRRALSGRYALGLASLPGLCTALREAAERGGEPAVIPAFTSALAAVRAEDFAAALHAWLAPGRMRFAVAGAVSSTAGETV